MGSTATSHLRQFSRVPFDAQVELHINHRRVTVQLLDISLKGALVETSTAETLALQDPCSLVLALAGSEESITMHGCIVHLERNHIGIQCQEIGISDMARLRRLIELNTGDAERVDRELTHLIRRTTL